MVRLQAALPTCHQLQIAEAQREVESRGGVGCLGPVGKHVSYSLKNGAEGVKTE